MKRTEAEGMGEESKADETLNKIDSLYADFENTLGYVKTYNNKYNVAESNSVEILNSDRSKSYKTLLITLAAKNLDETNDLITKLSEKLEKLRKFTLSEIAHRKLKELEFQIDNPFFFRKLRKDYRGLISGLNTLDDDATRYNTKDIENIVLRFENVIERLRNFEYEIEDEKRSGLYNSIVKSAVWGIPILIGLYQLIAMQYFTLNPYLPLVAYAIALFVIYLLLKSVTGIKFLYLFAKANKLHFLARFGLNIIAISLVIIILISTYILHKFDIGVILITTIMLIGIIPLTFMLIKETIGESKSDSIQNELDDLAIKYGVKE
jgi:archaellum component FlaC